MRVKTAPTPLRRSQGSKAYLGLRCAKYLFGDCSDAWNSGYCLIWVRKNFLKGLKLAGCWGAGMRCVLEQRAARAETSGALPSRALLGMSPLSRRLKRGQVFLPSFPRGESCRPRVPSPSGALGLPDPRRRFRAGLLMLCALPREGAPGLPELAAAASRALITAQLAHFLNSYLRRRAS